MNPIPTLPTPTCSNDAIRIPEPFRAALTELVEIGMSVARMVARAAQLEAAEAEAAAAELAAEVALPLARSLAEAIEADRAAVAASAARGHHRGAGRGGGWDVCPGVTCDPADGATGRAAGSGLGPAERGR